MLVNKDYNISSNGSIEYVNAGLYNLYSIYGDSVPTLPVGEMAIDVRIFNNTTAILTAKNNLYAAGQRGSCYGPEHIGSQPSFVKIAENVKDFSFTNGQILYCCLNGDCYSLSSNKRNKIAENVKRVFTTEGSNSYIIFNTGELSRYADPTASSPFVRNLGQDADRVFYSVRGSDEVQDIFYTSTTGNLYRKNGKYDNNFSKIAENVKSVSVANYSTWYVNNDGELYGYGKNYYGQQGSGDTTQVDSFTKRAENVKKVLVSPVTTWYLTNDGDLYGCGYNSSGQQGSGDTANVLTFTKRASNVKDFFINTITDENHYSAITWYINNEGDLYGTGLNTSGQQGSGNTTNVKIFTKRAENVKDVFLQRDSGVWYINNNNDLYGTGDNSRGQQGSGNTTNVLTFTKRAENCSKMFTQLRAYDRSNPSNIYITNDGKVYGAGYAQTYLLGIGDNPPQYVTTFTEAILQE